MNLPTAALHRPVTTVMVFISFVVFGAIAAKLLPLEKWPELDVPFVLVQVPYPNSTPADTERDIARPLEESLATLTKLKHLYTNASADQVTIAMEFDWKEDVSVRTVEIREKLDAVRGQLPDDVRAINLLKFNTTDAPLLTLRLSSERNLDNAWDLLQRNLVKPLERVDGVARVDLQGVEQPEVRILLDPSRIEAHQVNLLDLNQRLQQANFSASAGQIDSLEGRLRVKPIGEFRSVDEFRNFPINDDGLRLEDVATV